MSEERRDGEHGHDGPGRDGPDGTQFLHLEVSRWLEGGARAEADGIIRELLRSAVRERLEARLGDRLRAVGAAIADQIADDLEANLVIEAAIDARREAHQETAKKVQALFREPSSERASKKKR